jgi:hypothetical protein
MRRLAGRPRANRMFSANGAEAESGDFGFPQPFGFDKVYSRNRIGEMAKRYEAMPLADHTGREDEGFQALPAGGSRLRSRS